MLKPWRYVLSSPAFTSHASLAGIEFSNRWVTIKKSLLCVHAGYAWDGCSPTLKIPGTQLWLGPWDGPLLSDGHPAAYRATLFHDALCQFRRSILGLSKQSATGVFAAELYDSGAPAWMTWLYPRVADLLGPQDFPGNFPDDGHSYA